MNPLLVTAILKAVTTVNKARMTPVQAEASAKDIVEALKNDPTVTNATNGEPWWQSRVAWGSVFAALGVLLPPALGLFGVTLTADRIVEIGGALITLAGAGYALWGRFKSGLKPLFTRKG